MDSVSAIIDMLAKLQGTSFGILVAAILFGSYKGFWVWGRDYQELKRDRDEWKSLALNGTNLAKDLLTLHQQIPRS